MPGIISSGGSNTSSWIKIATGSMTVSGTMTMTASPTAGTRIGRLPRMGRATRTGIGGGVSGPRESQTLGIKRRSAAEERDRAFATARVLTADPSAGAVDKSGISSRPFQTMTGKKGRKALFPL